ncbi:helix-turn-helix domain-containing protein [Paenibacillus sp. OAS669]|uniref:helix-turn-helix domain-containing protein n=1 Tax=Paenibacillus sp. OAS669 TaxID=2663821 RepID=UPI001789641B|nr:helix-turn-helix domain-containing protein [Paenibacillus sp. OAS669]MBE1442961.1 AraC-like DNA-binding protein [Paenibacillus sp. OAS669]
MVRIKSISRGSAFTTLLLSYLAVFLLPIALGSILYTKTNTIMTDNANRANYAMLEQLRQVMDSKLRDVQLMSQQIALNPRLQWLMNNAETADSADAYKFVEFVSEHMSRYQNVSDLIQGYYVYLGVNDTVLMPTAKTSADVLYERLYRPVGTSFEAWRNGLISSPHYQDFIPVTYDTPTGTLDTITYIQTLPLGEPSDIRGALVILLDVNQIRSMLSKVESAYQSSVFILDRKEHLMIGNDRQALPWDQIRDVVQYKGVPYEYKDHGKEMMLSYTASEQNGWKYVHIMPKNVYLERVYTLRNWMITLLLICLAGGGAAIWFWLHRNYTPLRNVVRVLQNGKPLRTKQPSNEYEFIRETIQMTMDEERELRKTLSRQTPVIQASFLSRFIRGHVDVSRMTDESLAFMNIRFNSDLFAVILIDIADTSRFSADSSERQWALIRFIISNIGNDLIREREWGYSVELDQHRVALLVNFSEARRAEADQALDDIAARLKQMMEERFHTYITLAIGNMHEGTEHACESYFEALSALDYKMYRGHSSIIRYREISDTDGHYYYPIETEIQLINFTKSGDKENVSRLIDNLFHAHFSQRRISPELGRNFFINMVSTLWKIMNPMEPLYHEVFGEGFDPLKELSSCTTVEEMKLKIREWYLALCQHLNAGRSHHGRQLSERITRYIEEHYGDDMLSLTTIADHFSLTPQYLSAFFKKQTGMNLTDYLTRVRIEEAKKLMKDKKLTFTQIANKVGYASDIGFIRVFKKYEGTTPGKYRESL